MLQFKPSKTQLWLCVHCQVLIDKCLMIFVVTVFPIAVIVPIAIAVSIYACVFPIL